MDDQRVGAIFRAVRIRRGLRQEDVAGAAKVHRSWVSLVERGQLAGLPIDRLRAMAAALEIRLELGASWRGGEGARIVNERHSRMHELVADRLARAPGWVFASEVTFSAWGERGVVDILAWHAGSGTLLVLELKTEIPDPAGLVAQVDRYRRLAGAIGRGRGWAARHVAAWVLVADTATNRRQLARHRSLLRNAFPLDGRFFGPWLRDPQQAGPRPGPVGEVSRLRGPRGDAFGPVSGLSFLAYDHPGSASTGLGSAKRIRRSADRSATGPRPAGPARSSLTAGGSRRQER